MAAKVKNANKMLEELIDYYEAKCDELYTLNPKKQSDIDRIVALYNNTFLSPSKQVTYANRTPMYYELMVIKKVSVSGITKQGK